MTQKTKPFATLMVEILQHKELSPTNKIVYMHMRNQYIYFSSQGKPYIEAVQTIADAVNVSEKSVRNSIKKLIDQGYLSKQSREHNQSCMYFPRDRNIEYDKQKKKELVGKEKKPEKSVNRTSHWEEENIPF